MQKIKKYFVTTCLLTHFSLYTTFNFVNLREEESVPSFEVPNTSQEGSLLTRVLLQDNIQLRNRNESQEKQLNELSQRLIQSETAFNEKSSSCYQLEQIALGLIAQNRTLENKYNEDISRLNNRLEEAKSLIRLLYTQKEEALRSNSQLTQALTTTQSELEEANLRVKCAYQQLDVLDNALHQNHKL